MLFRNAWWGGDVSAPMQWTKFGNGDGKFHYPLHPITTSTTVEVFNLVINISNGRIYIDFGAGTVDFFGSGAEITHGRLHAGLVVHLTAKQYIDSELHANRSQLRSSVFNGFLNLLGVCVEEPLNSYVILVRW